ncbi:hypothetical protein HAX54_025882, partial [Datura stramonium]|nr:hypothetical protein [Datura stramonium]
VLKHESLPKCKKSPESWKKKDIVDASPGSHALGIVKRMYPPTVSSVGAGSVVVYGVGIIDFELPPSYELLARCCETQVEAQTCDVPANCGSHLRNTGATQVLPVIHFNSSHCLSSNL